MDAWPDNDRDIAIVKEQMTVDPWKAHLDDAVEIVRAGGVAPMPNGTCQVRSTSRPDMWYTVEKGKGCDCPHATKGGEEYCKHRVAAELDRRLQLRNNSHGQTPRPAAVPSQGAQIHDLGTAEYHERESARVCKLALDSIPTEYHHYISFIRQNINVGTRNSPRWIAVHNPYMQVDGRVALAQAEGPLTVNVEFAQMGEHIIAKAKVLTARGRATGHERVVFGDSGVSATNPMENAETGAVGRALGFLGYGLFGRGIASAEEVQEARERQAANGQAKPQPVETGEVEGPLFTNPRQELSYIVNIVNEMPDASDDLKAEAETWAKTLDGNAPKEVIVRLVAQARELLADVLAETS